MLGVLVDFSRGVVDQHDPGIVDQDIERRIVCDQLLRDNGDIRRIRNIQFDRMHPRIRLGRCIQMFLAAARDDYLVAELVQCFGEATANTSTSAGDEDGVFG